jgi:hypothetical protein
MVAGRPVSTWPPRQPGEQLVKLGRVVLQPTRSRRTHRTNHPAPPLDTTLVERNAPDHAKVTKATNYR